MSCPCIAVPQGSALDPTLIQDVKTCLLLIAAGINSQPSRPECLITGVQAGLKIPHWATVSPLLLAPYELGVLLTLVVCTIQESGDTWKGHTSKNNKKNYTLPGHFIN